MFAIFAAVTIAANVLMKAPNHLPNWTFPMDVPGQVYAVLNAHDFVVWQSTPNSGIECRVDKFYNKTESEGFVATDLHPGQYVECVGQYTWDGKNQWIDATALIFSGGPAH